MTEQTPTPDASGPSWVPDATVPQPPATPATPAASPTYPDAAVPPPPAKHQPAWLVPVVAAAALVIGLFGGFVAAHAFDSDGRGDSHYGIAGPGGVPGFGEGQDWDHDGNQGFPPGFGDGDGDGQQFAPPGSGQQDPSLPQPQQSSPGTQQRS